MLVLLLSSSVSVVVVSVAVVSVAVAAEDEGLACCGVRTELSRAKSVTMAAVRAQAATRSTPANITLFQSGHLRFRLNKEITDDELDRWIETNTSTISSGGSSNV